MTAPRENRGVEAYVSGLAGAGAPGPAHRFTVDPARALERLRDFQLADPAAYALLLVQAAVLRGAKAIRVTTSWRSLRLAFDGVPFSAAELEARFDGLLGEPLAGPGAALHKLVHGLQGLQGFAPRARVRLRSGDGRTGVVFTQGPGGAGGRVEETRPIAGTVIEIHRRTAAPPRDAALIAERCRHAGVTVTVDGQEVTARPWAPLAFGNLEVTGPCGPCQVAVEPLGPPHAELRIVQHGVVLEVRPMPGWPPHLRVAASADGLPTDLTQLALRESPGALALVEACQGLVRDRVDPQNTRHRAHEVALGEARRRLARLEKVGSAGIWAMLSTAMLGAGAVGWLTSRGGEGYALLFFPALAGLTGIALGVLTAWERWIVRPLARSQFPPDSILRDLVEEVAPKKADYYRKLLRDPPDRPRRR